MSSILKSFDLDLRKYNDYLTKKKLRKKIKKKHFF